MVLKIFGALLLVHGVVGIQSLQEAACLSNPNLSFCAGLRSNNDIDNNIVSDVDPVVDVVTPPRAVQAPPQASTPVIVVTQSTQPPRPSGSQVTPDPVARLTQTNLRPRDQFCVRYARSFTLYCSDEAKLDQLNIDAERAQEFCGSYAQRCNGDDSVQTAGYCDKYVQHYQYFCKNPLAYGPQALRFCPVYANNCNDAFEVPLFDLPDVQITPQPGIRNTATVDWFGGIGGAATRRPGQSGSQVNPFDPTGTGAEPSPAQVQKLCSENKTLAERFCFTNIGQLPQYKARCDLYKQYCT